MPLPLTVEIRAALRAAADPKRAPQMQAYMKSAMPLLGVRVPDARRLTRELAQRHPIASRAELECAVRELWDGAEYREERYAATAVLDTRAARALRSAELLPLYRDLIVSGAWWDHVDEISHRVGELRFGWPDGITPKMRKAIGWALRDYARTDPQWVRTFVATHHLSPLSQREALKHL